MGMSITYEGDWTGTRVIGKPNLQQFNYPNNSFSTYNRLITYRGVIRINVRTHFIISIQPQFNRSKVTLMCRINSNRNSANGNITPIRAVRYSDYRTDV